MLSVENFSQVVCLRLLEQGYTHFVVKYRIDKQEIDGDCNVIAFEAVRNCKYKAAIPIPEVIDLTDDAITKYRIIHATNLNRRKVI